LRTNNYKDPKGSILGPFLFLLYVNDMSNALQLTLRLFADDTSILLNYSNLATLPGNINEEVTKLSDWSNAKKLTLNLTKSNVMMISFKFNSIV